jgi:hypothetical protein
LMSKELPSWSCWGWPSSGCGAGLKRLADARTRRTGERTTLLPQGQPNESRMGRLGRERARLPWLPVRRCQAEPGRLSTQCSDAPHRGAGEITSSSETSTERSQCSSGPTRRPLPEIR